MIINDETLNNLKAAAKKASENAYSPYSSFSVGAAVVDRDGKIYTGCNVENASYGLTQCAERNALSAAIAGGSTAGNLLALVIYLQGIHALPPCGACRQVMYELMAENSQIVACCDSDDKKSWTRDQCLPDPFIFKKYV